MTIQTFCTHFMFWSLGAFMVVHYAWVKQPAQSREIASWQQQKIEKSWYDASWKQ